MIITDALFADFGKLGSFVFKDNVMWSQQGSKPNYTDPGFVPNLEIDGETGKITAKDVDIEGKITATEGSFKGKVSVPFVIIDSFTSDSIINLDDSFNITTHSYIADKTIYLPVDEKYNGVTCHLYNGGMTTNEGSFKVRVEGEQGFIGGSANYANKIGTEISIHKGQIGQFICVKTLGGGINWACTNYADLQL